ncbi:hypothetical protein DFH09DRAFT_462390 [Mycena vulgaris]|nr:hypothetical protein DFH09DRAFT_462390 [Mycena vulgaris]
MYSFFAVAALCLRFVSARFVDESALLSVLHAATSLFPTDTDNRTPVRSPTTPTTQPAASTAASTLTAPSIPSPSLSTFKFARQADMITCTPATISWTYIAGETSNNVMKLLMVKGHFIDMITDGVIDPSTGSYTWASVNVTAGNYTLAAAFPPDTTPPTSLPVFVVNGPNISCLASTLGGTPSASLPATHTTTTTTPSDTTLRRTSKTSPGIIAGAVLGALALLATALSAYLCVTRRTRRGARRPLDSPRVESQMLPEIQQQAGTPAMTVLALDRPVASGVVESQEAMMFKIQGLRSGVLSARESPTQSQVDVHQRGPGQVDMAQQLREMAERMAFVEAHIRVTGVPESAEPPPGYTLGAAP